MSLRSPSTSPKAPRIAWLALAAVLIAIGWPQGTHAQAPQQAGDVETIRVRPNVYMLAGAGGNIVVHLGWMGVVLVDTGSAEVADKGLAGV